MKSKKFVFLLLNFSGNFKKYNNEIYSLNLDLPIPTYANDWNTTKFKNSQLGKYVENYICNFVKNVIEIEMQSGL